MRKFGYVFLLAYIVAHAPHAKAATPPPPPPLRHAHPAKPIHYPPSVRRVLFCAPAVTPGTTICVWVKIPKSHSPRLP